MKKIIIILLVTALGCGNVYSQAKRTQVKRTQTNVSAKAKVKAKAEVEAKAKADAEAKAKTDAEEAKAQEIAFNNSNCRFGFGTGKFVSSQSSNEGFVVYEVPNMNASELKSSVFTTLSSMYKSPKDVITSLSDNMIQIEGYAESIFVKKSKDFRMRYDMLFNMIIQFKDGKVRYNAPTIKMLYMEMPLLGKMGKCDMNKGIPYLIDDSSSREKVASYFNEIINNLNRKLKQSNDW